MSVENKEYLEAILPMLAEPMPYKWRVQSFSKNKAEATCVAYIDSRDVMERLDKVCVYGWNRSHTEIKDNIYCSVGVVMPDGQIFYRQDCGTESSTEKEKGESSDSFKRAAVNWGVGRFLYDLDIKRLSANEVKTTSNYPYPVDGNGKRIWDLTKHINAMLPKPPQDDEPKQLTDEEYKALCVEHHKTIDAISSALSNYEAALGMSDLESASGFISLASEAWYELKQETQQHLWRAYSRGGCFTTAHQKIIKSTEFRQANNWEKQQ